MLSCPLIGDELFEGGDDIESLLIGLISGLTLSIIRDSIDDAERFNLCVCDGGSCGT